MSDYVANPGTCEARVYDKDGVTRIDIKLHKSPGCSSENILSRVLTDEDKAKYRKSYAAYLASKPVEEETAVETAEPVSELPPVESDVPPEGEPVAGDEPVEDEPLVEEKPKAKKKGK